MPKVKGNPLYLPGSMLIPFNSEAERDAAYPATSPRVCVYMSNPNVPEGATRILHRGGGVWAVPSGEVIYDLFGNALADHTPGVVATLAEIFGSNFSASPIIPEYLVRTGQAVTLQVKAFAKNAAGVAGCRLLACISGSLPSLTAAHEYPWSAVVQPDGVGRGAETLVPTIRKNISTWSNGTDGGRPISTWVYPAESNSNRVWLMAYPSHINDRIILQRVQIAIASA